MHVELNNQYEEKLRQAILYLVDKIEWPTFYDQLARIIDIWDEIKRDEDNLRPIVQKWSERIMILLLCTYLSSNYHVIKSRRFLIYLAI